MQSSEELGRKSVSFTVEDIHLNALLKQRKATSRMRSRICVLYIRERDKIWFSAMFLI